MTLPDRNRFESAYAGQAPWDIGRPQRTFIDVADKVIESILEVVSVRRGDDCGGG